MDLIEGSFVIPQWTFNDVSPGYIDLSKRRVSPEEIKKCEEKFTKAKAVSFCYY